MSAFVGKTISSFPPNSPESRQKYHRVIAEWLANDRQSLGALPVPQERLLVNEVLLKWSGYYAWLRRPV